MTRLYVPGVPRPQGSKRHVGRGIMVESSKHLPAWRRAVAAAARTAHTGTPYDGPVTITAEFIMPRPKNWGKNRQDAMIQRPDLDKLIRAVMDGISGIIIRDDSQAVRMLLDKRRAAPGEEPGVVVVVDPAG